MNYLVDTIAAVSTPLGIGGIGIIRISGSEAIKIAEDIFLAHSGIKLSEMKGYSLHLGTVIVDDKQIDEALVLLFRAPKSYTGEDLVEIQCHGGSIVVETILRGLIDRGARIAFAGEFTRRAVVNNRISLSEAEGVGELISAVSKQGEIAAYALSKGSLFRQIEIMKERILYLQSAITAFIDFPEEDVEPINEEEMNQELSDLQHSLQSLLEGYKTGLVMLNGITTAIVGGPNVGKSTIMNLLAGYEKSIVTPIAGTTRDILEHQIRIDEVTLVLSDTAGIHSTDNIVERIGVDRALEKILEVDLILAVFDNSSALNQDDYRLIEELASKKVIAIVNKIDLPRILETTVIEESFSQVIYISANAETSRSTICEAIKRVAGVNSFSEELPIIVNERQRMAVVGALGEVSNAKQALVDGITVDVIYISLDNALGWLMELSGEGVSEAVLDEVFSRFCVGK